MDGNCRYEISQGAYVKLILHSLKHRSSAVNGVLLGRLRDGAVEISDAVPLFHSQLGLLAPLELALIQIEEYFGSKGLSIVGYYHANERYEDANLNNIAIKIGDHISRYFPHAALLLLNNKKLEALPKTKNRSPVLELYIKDSSKRWRQVESDGSRLVLKEPLANIVSLDYISSEKWQEVVDFDEHLDDVSKDWLNPNLFK
ncbi:hypothetical protein QJS10_CPA05g01666 [Acorus calamus]|uniref:MPN domain-containing protein n=1 Tax=Acorus calamus TaxID=4465 RepID=A0AAV9EPM2_ACOCL|nr:hypothetical protein QJS10_CPA05g01674 [Acorus calamus]KAK1317288.1 hypothetical protein QJS10_CPA05g01666 [Acorus calamus]